MRPQNFCVILLTGVATLAFVHPAYAQAADAAAAKAPDLTKEIIVTAQRFKTLESKTPVSMEVISGDKLKVAQIHDVQALTEQDTSLNFATGNGSGSITMRGISGVGGVGPSVPIAFDGFYYNLNYIFNNALYDIGQVEVLRGPQGTLFGRNSSGGLVNITTADPTHTLSGYGKVTIGNYREVDTEAAVNVPLSENLAIRGAFASNNHGGYRQLATDPSQKIDDADSLSGRIKVLFTPLEHLTILASAQFTHIGGNGTTDNIYNLPADSNLFPTHVALNLPDDYAKKYNIAVPPMVRINDQLYQLHVTYDGLPHGISVSYIGGIDQLSYHHVTPTVGLDAVTYAVPTTVVLDNTIAPRTQNHELRLASNPDQALKWQVGVYYFASHELNVTHFHDVALPGSPDLVELPYFNEQKSIAGYGQASWNVAQNTVSLGLRYTSDISAQTDLASPGDGIFPARQSVHFSKLTWHIGDSYQIDARNMVYAKIDTGYRAGFFNLNTPCNCTGGPPLPSTITPYRPEYVTAYEIGSKNRIFNDRLALSFDLFYLNYSGQQLLESNQTGVFTVNGTASHIYGAEMNAAVYLPARVKLDFNATLLHAKFGDQTFTNAVNQTYNIGQNYLPQSPVASLAVGIEKSEKIAGGDLRLRIQTKYQSGQYYDFYNFADSFQKRYTRSDAYLTYTSDDRHWNAEVFVRNIENSIVIADESESFAPPLTQPGTYNIGFQSPRTFGVSFGASF